MSNIATIITKIENILTAEGLTKLTHTLDLSKNKFSPTEIKFGIIPAGQKQVEGVTKHLTVDYAFNVILAKSYITTAHNDDALMALSVDMLNIFNSAYIKAVQTKLSIPHLVKLIDDLAVGQPIIAEKEKLLFLEASFIVRSFYLI